MTLSVIREGGVARVTLDRPEVHNAFNGDLIRSLAAAFHELAHDDAVRVVVLAGAGRSFSAGADLAWMRSAATLDAAQNAANALELAGVFEAIDVCPKPVVGRVHGAAVGGGVGLVACCDVVVAGPRARFRLSEVRLGMAPAVISPYVVAKVGSSRARALFITGDWMDAAQALDAGLVHRLVAEEDALDGAVDAAVQSCLAGGPRALAACKTLAREVLSWPDARERTARMIAELRVGPEAQARMAAFLEKAE